MIGRAEIEQALTGAWKVFLSRPDAMRSFDTSLEGFWRSFQAILIVAPVYLLTELSDQMGLVTNGAAVAPEKFWATEILSLVLDWIALPALLAVIGGPLGIKRAYPAYIVVRNWATPLMLAPFAAISLLSVLGVSEDILLIPSVAAVAYSLRFSYLVVRRTLTTHLDVAIGYVVLDVLVSLAVVRVVAKLTGVDPFG
ncbi:MAG TPA: hypothetical protein VHA70_14510 [Bauldia sp.]|nr:hypothetical protein [Bauldia sp.]